MDPVTQLIWKRFRIRRGDTLPYCAVKGRTRDDLAALFAELKFTSGAEVGVAEGRFSEVLCKANPDLHLLSVDPWEAYENWSQEKCDIRAERAKQRLGAYNVEIRRQQSIDAALQVPEGSLDFVYIDGCHVFDWVMTDIILWAQRVRPGGIVSGHDYYKFYRAGVQRAVDVYTWAHNIPMWYLTREKEATWWWVKP